MNEYATRIKAAEIASRSNVPAEQMLVLAEMIFKFLEKGLRPNDGPQAR